MISETELKTALTAVGQEHLLRFWPELDAAGRAKLAGEIAALDLNGLAGLIKEYVLQKPKTVIPDDLGPAPFFALHPRSDAESAFYVKARKRGAELLKSGRVCCLTVAGGQGTRLGFDGPKGTYPIGPVSGRTLFEYFAGNILRAGEKYGRPITWYVMTSLLNREATERFFREHDYLGLAPEQVFFFTQGTMPAIGYDGKLLLGSKDGLALSPDGHGGTLLALRKSGALDRMAAEGTDVISYFQVDNPLVAMTDPLFLGLHDLEGAEMSAIMLAKTNPFEKLGNFCVSGGRTHIIEYSDLPEELAVRKNPDGTLAFIAGSPAMHLIRRQFVERLTAGGSLKLPWHRADKKIPCVDASGAPVKPETPNGVKLESFIFDALPMAEKVMILEGDRAEVFGPTKNATGVDSAESCRAMLVERDAKRLEAAGISVPRKADGTVDALIEIAPRIALDADDVKAYAGTHSIRILSGDRIVLE